MSTTQPTVKAMQVIVFGRVESVRKYEEYIYTSVVCPSEDKYTAPSVIQIRSKTRLGQQDEEIKQLCKVGGYRRKAYQAKDKDTGEIVTVRPIEVILEAI